MTRSVIPLLGFGPVTVPSLQCACASCFVATARLLPTSFGTTQRTLPLPELPLPPLVPLPVLTPTRARSEAVNGITPVIQVPTGECWVSEYVPVSLSPTMCPVTV